MVPSLGWWGTEEEGVPSRLGRLLLLKNLTTGAQFAGLGLEASSFGAFVSRGQNGVADPQPSEGPWCRRFHLT